MWARQVKGACGSFHSGPLPVPTWKDRYIQSKEAGRSGIPEVHVCHCMYTYVHVCRPDDNLRCHSLDAVWDRPTLEINPGPLPQKPLPSCMGSCGHKVPCDFIPTPWHWYWEATQGMDRRHLPCKSYVLSWIILLLQVPVLGRKRPPDS